MPQDYPDEVDDPVQFILDKFENEEIMVDAFYQWAINPTSMSAGYGVSENYPFIQENIKIRYNLSEKEADEYLKKLRDACDWLISVKGMSYQLRDEIKTAINFRWGEKFRNKILERIKGSPDEIRKAVYLFGELTISSDFLEIQQESDLVIFAAIYNASIANVGAIDPILRELVRVGILNKLLWISSGKSGEKFPRYVVPLFAEEILYNVHIYLERPETPDVSKYIATLFEENKNEQLRIIDEVLSKKDWRGIRGVYADPKRLLRFVPFEGIIGRYRNYVAISSFILDELEEILFSEKEKRIEFLRINIEDKLNSLKAEYGPSIEIYYEDENLWKIESMDEPTLYIYLSTWLITEYLNKFEDENSHLLIVVTNQSFPSIKRFLENYSKYFVNIESISALSIDGERADLRLLKGRKHRYLEHIVEGLKTKKNTDVKASSKTFEVISKPPSPVQTVPSSRSDLKILLGIKGDEKVFWEPKNERNWNFVIVGSAGTGKTQTVKAILQEFTANKLPYIILDFRKDYISVETKTSEFGQILDLNKIRSYAVGLRVYAGLAR